MEQIACNLCASSRTKLVFRGTNDDIAAPRLNAAAYRCTSTEYGRHPPIVQCLDCGLVYANPRVATADILENYRQVVDDTYVEADEAARWPTFRRNLRPLAELCPSRGRILDIGCYVGAFLHVAQEAGWEAWGVEPGDWAARRAQAGGFNVSAGTLDQADFADAFFDAVTMWDVVEHLADPLAELRQVNRLLKPGGFALVHTMNIASPFARLLGKRWPWLMEMHLYYFSPRTLQRMLETAGLKVVARHTQGRYVELGYLASRLEGYSQGLARGLGRLMTTLHMSRRLVPVNFGDLMTVIAQKPPTGNNQDTRNNNQEMTKVQETRNIKSR